jgi:hypothetical protein
VKGAEPDTLLALLSDGDREVLLDLDALSARAG